MREEFIGRAVFWLIPPALQWLFYVLVALSSLWAAWQVYRRVRAWRRGRPGGRRAPAPGRVLAALGAVFGQGRLWRDPQAGLMHSLAFYGFVLLALGSGLLAVSHDLGLDFLVGNVYLAYSLVMDLAGAALVAGLVLAVWRRHVKPLGRLQPSVGATAFLFLLLAVALSGFLTEAARIAYALPAHEAWSPLGYGMAFALRLLDLPAAAWQTLYLVGWWLHVALFVLFVASAVSLYTRHLVLVPAHLWAGAALQEETAAPGAPEPAPANSLTDLAWQTLMASDACTTCGRCHAACPALASGKPLDPRELIQRVRGALDQAAAGDGDRPLTGLVSADELWSCTTCGACAFECPAGISPLGLITETRSLLIEQGEVPAQAARALENTAHRGDPWGNPRSRRLDWLGHHKVNVLSDSDTEVDLLVWVGCAGAFDPSARNTSRALVSLLEKAGVPFAVLGSAERCCGEPARRMGEKGLFARLAEENVAVLRRHGVRRIVTACPHCFDTLKNAYPPFGGTAQVVHHTQLLAELVAAGKLQPTRALGLHVTLHDPCYLGRHNGEFAAPRTLVSALPGVKLTEMPRHGEQSFCCGGGGGQLWVQTPGGGRMEEVRFREAAATGADVVATACPGCKVMLEAAAASVGNGSGLRVRDIAELLDECT